MAAARLFVALELPPPAVAALVAWRDRALAQPGARDALRAVRRESLHVTLCFLGSLDERAVAPLAAAVAEEAARAGAVGGLALGAPLWLPRRRPRALALALTDHAGALGRLQASLAERLADHGWYERERRPYLPHVTVARVRAGQRPPRVALPPDPRAAFAGAAVTLYRSHLAPSGARYEPLARRLLPS